MRKWTYFRQRKSNEDTDPRSQCSGYAANCRADQELAQRSFGYGWAAAREAVLLERKIGEENAQSLAKRVETLEGELNGMNEVLSDPSHWLACANLAREKDKARITSLETALKAERAKNIWP